MKQMRTIRNSILPVGKGFGAINLFGILFVKGDVALTPELVNHEMIHTAQMKEMLYIPFYILYVVEWLVRLVQFKGRTYEAYYNISFEREAYREGGNPEYLKHRKKFAQWRHR